MSRIKQAASFRQAEVNQLLDWVRGGESASIVGISGVGKSNLFNHLLDPQIQQKILGETASEIVFVRTNFHFAPDNSSRTVYSLILEQLETLGEASPRPWLKPEQINLIGTQHDLLLDAGGDELKVQRYFKKAIQILIGQSDRQLVFLFDQFDEVYRDGTPSLFANLRGLREAYKYRISFFVFTRDLLPNLAPLDPGREEFFELMASNEMGLQPYNDDDALAMLQRICRRDSLPLDNDLAEIVIELSGGHAGLIRSIYLAVRGNDPMMSPEPVELVDMLLMIRSVDQECRKIWASLSTDEQRTVACLAHNVPDANESLDTQRRLELKGVINKEKPGDVFSPLLTGFARSQDAPWERSIHLDEGTRRVWVLGQPSEPLTKLEYDLFKALYDQPNSLVSRDELVDAGWPEAQGGVSEEALNAAMSRLRRKIEPDPKEARFIEVLRGQGYRLIIPESSASD